MQSTYIKAAYLINYNNTTFK